MFTASSAHHPVQCRVGHISPYFNKRNTFAGSNGSTAKFPEPRKYHTPEDKTRSGHLPQSTLDLPLLSVSDKEHSGSRNTLPATPEEHNEPPRSRDAQSPKTTQAWLLGPFESISKSSQLSTPQFQDITTKGHWNFNFTSEARNALLYIIDYNRTSTDTFWAADSRASTGTYYTSVTTRSSGHTSYHSESDQTTNKIILLSGLKPTLHKTDTSREKES